MSGAWPHRRAYRASSLPLLSNRQLDDTCEVLNNNNKKVFIVLTFLLWNGCYNNELFHENFRMQLYNPFIQSSYRPSNLAPAFQPSSSSGLDLGHEHRRRSRSRSADGNGNHVDLWLMRSLISTETNYLVAKQSENFLQREDSAPQGGANRLWSEFQALLSSPTDVVLKSSTSGQVVKWKKQC